MKKKFKDFLNGEPCTLYYATTNKITPCLCSILTYNEAINRGYYPYHDGVTAFRLSTSKKNPMRCISFPSSNYQVRMQDHLDESCLIIRWDGEEHGRLCCACTFVIEHLKNAKQNINKKIFEYQKLMHS